jgi:hypothetical protein
MSRAWARDDELYDNNVKKDRNRIECVVCSSIEHSDTIIRAYATSLSKRQRRRRRQQIRRVLGYWGGLSV